MQAGELANPGHVGYLLQALVVYVARAQGQVVAQGAVEQLNILRYVTDVVAQVGYLQLLDINAINQQMSAVGLIQIQQQLLQCAFARTTASDDADVFAGQDAQVQVVERRVLLARIGKAEVPCLDGPMQLAALSRNGLRLALLRHAHHFVGSADGQARLLVAREQTGYL